MTVAIGALLADGRDVQIDVPLREIFAAYLTIQEVGYTNAVSLINCWVGVNQEFAKQDAGEHGRSAHAVLLLLEDQRSPVDVSRKQREREILAFCYLLRTRMKMSLTKSAEVASVLLGEQIEAEAWRKRLERYARREHKEKAGRRRRTKQHA